MADEQPKPTIDERLSAVTMNLELLSYEIKDLKAAVDIDAANIRSLLHMMELHERRIRNLEGSE